MRRRAGGGLRCLAQTRRPRRQGAAVASTSRSRRAGPRHSVPPPRRIAPEGLRRLGGRLRGRHRGPRALGAQHLERDLDHRAPRVHGRGPEPTKGLLLAEPVAIHEPALGALDHLAVLEGAPEALRLVESSHGKVQGRRELPAAEGLEQEAHDAGLQRARHQRRASPRARPGRRGSRPWTWSRRRPRWRRRRASPRPRWPHRPWPAAPARGRRDTGCSPRSCGRPR